MSGKPKYDQSRRPNKNLPRGKTEGDGVQSIGYCNPPKQHQWPAGHCPNPKGRPKKRQSTMKKATPPSEFERCILEDGSKVIGEIGGRPINNFERMFLKLKAESDNLRTAKYLFEKYEAASKNDHAWRLEAVSDLLAYKEDWGPIFDLQRRLKKPLPKQYPDPADIVITSPTDFKFLGPVTADEAEKWKLFQDGREAFFLVAHEIMDKAGDVTTVDEAKAHWDKLRRKYYRMTRHLPVAFKKKHPAAFPAFDPNFTMPEEGAESAEQMNAC